EGMQELARGRVPQARGAVPGSREHSGAVWTEDGLLDKACMSAEGTQELARGRVPQARGVVPGSREHSGAVWTEDGLLDRAFMPQHKALAGKAQGLVQAILGLGYVGTVCGFAVRGPALRQAFQGQQHAIHRAALRDFDIGQSTQGIGLVALSLG